MAQELVDLFNFHRFDNMRYSEKKMDPRQYRVERKGLSNTTLLFAANSGDLGAIKRYCDHQNENALPSEAPSRFIVAGTTCRV